MSRLAADLLPRPERSSGLPWLIAVAAFLIALVVTGALVLDRSANAIDAVSLGRVTVSIIEADPVRREEATRRALAILSSGTLAGNVKRFPQVDIGRLVYPYLGRGEADIVLPALIDVDLRSGVGVAAVRTALRPIASASVDADGATSASLQGLVASLRTLALTILLVSAIVAMLAVTLGVRAALSSHAGILETLHGLGATDAQLAHLLGRRAALDVLVGATCGILAAGAVILAVGAQLDGRSGASGPPPGDWAIVAALPPMLALATMLATRLAILRRLRRAI